MTEKKEESSKLSMAAGGLSKKDEKLLAAFHELHLEPNIESSTDLVDFLSTFGKLVSDKSPSSSAMTSHHFPRLSTFYGEENKGEVSWETFKFEIESLISDKFGKEQIVQSIRRATKGNAGDILRRLGPGVTLEEILHKFESTFGSVETKESVLKKFYSCQQGQKENITTFTSRLEDIHSQAVVMDALPKDDMILKSVLYQGLRTDMKHLAAYKNDSIKDYDKFKIELRKIEAELQSDTKTCHANITHIQERTDMQELKEMLGKINKRIDKLEIQKEQGQLNEPQRNNYDQREKSGGTYINNGGGRGRGERVRSDERQDQRRPLGTQTFQPTCFRCKGKGHQIKDCPSIDTRQCYKCQATGHIARYCPNLN